MLLLFIALEVEEAKFDVGGFTQRYRLVKKSHLETALVRGVPNKTI